MAYAKYTFFEAATQHGYIMACVGGRVAKSREFCQIVIDPRRGRVFQAFKTTRPDKPYIEFVIPERETTESTKMWEVRARKAVEDAWKTYEKAKAAARSGAATLGSSEPTPSKTESLSTDAPPNQESLSGPSVGEEPVIAASALGLSTPESFKTDGDSSPPSKPQSPKSGSKSRSSSGASKAKSGSATARAESTSPKN